MIRVKRIYDADEEEDGFRILVDRVWPRGFKKDNWKINLWLKNIAPTSSLRKWFYHDPDKWDEFKRRYFEELKDKNELVNDVIDKCKLGTVTLIYGTKEERYNNAVALKEYVDSKIEEKKDLL